MDATSTSQPLQPEMRRHNRADETRRSMATLVTDPELEESLLMSRRAMGGDRYDEVWEGIYVMSPLANNEHQALVSDLTTVLNIVVGWTGEGTVFAGVNVSDRREDWQQNYRCPDVAVFLRNTQAENHGAFWFGGPDFAVEITSRGDRSATSSPSTRVWVSVNCSSSSAILGSSRCIACPTDVSRLRAIPRPTIRKRSRAAFCLWHSASRPGTGDRAWTSAESTVRNPGGSSHDDRFLHRLRCGMFPVAAVFARQPEIGFVVANHLPLLCVPSEAPAEFHREVRQDAGGGGDVPLLDIGHRPFAALAGGEEVLHVPPRGGSGKDLRLFVREVFRVLFAFVQKVAMFRIAASLGNEVVSPDAELQRSLVAVQSGTPRIVRFRILPPVPLIPHELHVTVVEQGRLGIVRVDIGIGAAFRIPRTPYNTLRPAEVEVVADRIEEINAQVARLPITELTARPANCAGECPG